MASVEAQIRNAIAAYLSDPSQLGLTVELASLARTLKALPVYADMGGALLIRPDGQVLEVSSDVSWTDPSPPFRVVSDSASINQAYDRCAERFPRLQATIAEMRGIKCSDI
jgi:hypothetical protein